MGTTGQSITLANSIIGVGILAMPFCFQQCGVLLATLLLLLMGFVSRLCCHFLLKSAIITRRRTFEFLAFHVFGPAGKLAVEVGIIGFLMGTCIAYFVVVGDLGPQIIAKMLNINQSDILRTSIMVIVSLVCVLPLGLLRNVDSLSNVSAATICFYFCLVIKVILEATSQLLTADWHISIETWKPSGVLQCVPIFSMALFCQTQLFEIFESLPSLSLEKMNVVTKNAINICTAVYFTLGFFGYVAFSSQNISGNILMSLSPTLASDVIKLGFVMSLAFSFPLIIFPCRASLYSFLYKKVHPAHHDHIINHSIPETTFRCITVAIIAVALFISLLLPNIELVLGLLGSTIGVLICVVFPAACFINVTFKNTNERLLAKVVFILGLIILILGTYANLQAAESKYDDKYITQERIDKMVEDFFEMEKHEGVRPKAEIKHDPIPNNLKENAPNEIMKDSEVQPPNPIPPESHSNEKAPELPVPIVPKLKQVESEQNPIKNAPNVVPDAEAKHIEIKIDDAKMINGNNKVQPVNIEKPKEAMKPESSPETIDIFRKQQLIKTVKHLEEKQEDLKKEQKDIKKIVEIKNDLKKVKKEIVDNEAKKIAVESIQKIANMAIQSLTGVTDKPASQVDEVDRKAEPLQKIAKDAIQDIAKKAAETLEAIGEKKDPKEHLMKSAELQSRKNVNLKSDDKIIDSVKPKIEIKNDLSQAVKHNEVRDPDPVQPQTLNNVQQGENNLILTNKEDARPLEKKSNNEIDKKATQNLMIVEEKILKVKDEEKTNKEHSHSPDEPQSYKQGEDLVKKNIPNSIQKDIAHNVPIAIALKGNSQVNSKTQKFGNGPIKKESDDKQNTIVKKDDGISQNGVISKNGASVNIVRAIGNNANIDGDKIVRQKREVVDCTENTKLKPEDKQICENLVGSHNELPSESKLDINLPLNLPLHSNIIHRSLKNYNDEDNALR